MPEEIIMPKLGMTMETGIITKWYKKEGEQVMEGAPVVEIMTDKANMDVEAPTSGILAKIFAPEGEEIPVGEVIGLIKLPGEREEIIEQAIKKYEKPKKPSQNLKSSLKGNQKISIKSDNEYKPATPFAKQMAKKLGINLNEITSRIVTAKELQTSAKTQKMTPMMKVMADKMMLSSKIPQFTLYYDMDAQRLIELDKTLKEKGIKSSITAIITKILSNLLSDFTIFNAYLNGDSLNFRDTVNIGIAVATNYGLIVPVIKDTKNLTPKQFFEEFNKVVSKARKGVLSPEELEGASITVSNLGPFGVNSFRALLVPGQSAILGVSSIMEKPVVKDGGIFIGKIMNISISCDHRFVDGATAARFMQAFKNTIEEHIEEEIKWD